MRQYYNPSDDEIKIIDNVVRQLKSIAKHKFGMKDPCVDFAYENGLQYSRIHENKELAVVLSSFNAENVRIRVMIQNGVFAYYKHEGMKFFVTKPNRMTKNADVKIKHGKWTTEFDNVQGDRKKKSKENSSDGLYERPNFYNPPVKQQKESSQELYDTKYERYLRRKEYCQQYREMFGTESTEVTDEYYFFGDF